jgi:hypothetical protein
MTRLGEILARDGYKLVPRIDRADVHLLWHSAFWDGPLSGMVLYRGELCWCQMVAESDPDSAEWYRHFAVIRLSDEQRAEEQRWHDLFREKVGRHTDYDENQQRPVGELRPREEWPSFYDAYCERTPQDFSANEVLGWFEW